MFDGAFVPLVDTDLDVTRRSFEINTLGALRMMQAFLPGMRSKNFGRIVNVSSGMGQLSDMNSGSCAYRMSKVALNALTVIAADENKSAAPNVLVNCMCPGLVATAMTSHRGVTPTQGADTAVWLGTLGLVSNGQDGDATKTGGFWRRRVPMAW